MSDSEHIVKIRLTGDSAEIVGHSNKAANSIESVGDESARTAGKLRDLDKSSDKASKSGRELAGSFSAVKTAIFGTSAAFAAMSLVNTIGETQTLNIRLQELSGTTSAYVANQEYLRETAELLRKDYFLLADSYADLLALQKGGVLTQKESRSLLEGLSDASAALGASNQQLGQSLYGMSQGLSQSTVRAEEFNQIVEPLPGLMQAIDKAAGQAAGGFRKLVTEGKISGEYFKQVLIKAFEEFEGAAERAGKTIPGAMTDIGNAYTEVAAQLEQPISAALVPVLESIAAGIRVIPELADEASTLLNVLTAFAAVRFLPGLFSLMSSRLSNATRQFKTASVSVDIYGAKLKTATTTQRLFNTALGALGGPLGIVSTLLLSGAIELLNYKSASDEAIEATKKWGKELEKTESIFDRFINKQKEANTIKVTGLSYEEMKLRISEVTSEIDKLERKLIKLKRIGASASRLGRLEIKLRGLRDELEKLGEPARKGASALEKLVGQLEKQRELFGKTRQETRLLTVEQTILNERNKLTAQSTRAQVLAFEDYASRARESANALNELERAQTSFKDLQKENSGSAKIIDLATERAKQLEQEANSYAASAALRDNAHQQRMAQIQGHLSDEFLFKLQQHDLELQLEEQQYAQQAATADARFQETQTLLSERRKLALENELLSKEQRTEILLEVDAQNKALDDSYKAEKEAGEIAHEQRITDIKQRGAELRAQLEEQQRQRDLQGASRFFGNLASLAQSGSKKLFKISQAAAIGQTIVNTYAAAQRAMAEISFPLNIAVAASEIAAGLGRVQQIRNTQVGSSSVSTGSTSSSIPSSSAPAANNVVPFNPAPQQQTASREQHAASNFQNGGGVTVHNEFKVEAKGNDNRKLAEDIVDQLNTGAVSVDQKARWIEEISDAVVRKIANG